ncbi:hypothetical protein AB205_0064910, partial [Aquarana catesbeiana]
MHEKFLKTWSLWIQYANPSIPMKNQCYFLINIRVSFVSCDVSKDSASHYCTKPCSLNNTQPAAVGIASGAICAEGEATDSWPPPRDRSWRMECFLCFCNVNRSRGSDIISPRVGLFVPAPEERRHQ